MNNAKGLIIAAVQPGSIAAAVGLKPGDRLVKINGQPLRDVIDYRFLLAEEEVELLVYRADGTELVIEMEKEFDEELGVELVNGGLDNIRRCHNRCLFCFVDQMPPGMRPTLYVKDDDYRLSFLTGSFITLTNLRSEDWQRIMGQRLGPLYISVHATDPAVRVKLMGNRAAGRILEQLRELAAAGITMHTQVVLCPGINDGRVLERTIDDLSRLWPAVRSLAVVPVGLTAYREGCYPLEPVTPQVAREILELVHHRQGEFKARFNYPFVFAADEFYLLAEKPVPPWADYADFPQTENGVGLIRLFYDEWSKVRKKLPPALPAQRRVTIVTGVLGGKVLAPLVAELSRVDGLTVRLLVVENQFFGRSVTVAGLLTGRDILSALKVQQQAGLELGTVIVPAVALRRGTEVFLDDVSLTELSQSLSVPVVAAGSARDLGALCTSKSEVKKYRQANCCHRRSS